MTGLAPGRYLASQVQFPEIPARPDPSWVAWARDLVLRWVLGGLPWCSPADKANDVAILVTQVPGKLALPSSEEMISVEPQASAAIWARVSAADQDTANQLGQLREWAARRGLAVAAEYVTEDSGWANGNGAKGTAFDQARDELIDSARLGRYQVVLVWAIDRLSRRGIEDTLACVRRLTEAGCSVWSHQESWAEDLKDPRMRQLFLAIAAWMAEMESARRSERIRAGIERRRARGLPVGGKPGRRDRKPRRRSGYVAAWEPGGKRRERAEQARSGKS